MAKRSIVNERKKTSRISLYARNRRDATVASLYKKYHRYTRKREIAVAQYRSSKISRSFENNERETKNTRSRAMDNNRGNFTTKRAKPSCFQQCVRIARHNWEAFAKKHATSMTVVHDADGEPTAIRLNSDILASMTDERGADMLLSYMLALNTYRSHAMLWRAAETDPLSVIFSTAYTISATAADEIELDRNLSVAEIEARCHRTWYPLSLVCGYIDEISELTRNANRSEKSVRSPELGSIFAMEQVVGAVDRFAAIRKELRDMNREEATAKYEIMERTYLASDVFRDRCEATPYGTCVRKNDTTIEYVSDLYFVPQRDRLVSNFVRAQAFDPLRRECESRLRERFPRYDDSASARRLCVQEYVFPAIFDSERRIKFDDGSIDWATRSKSRLIYWQYHKSGLLWFLLHTMFALNNLAKNDALNLDLLRYVSRYLIDAIECGVCKVHWEMSGQKYWSLYEDRYEFGTAEWNERRRAYETGSDSRVTGNKMLSYYATQQATDFSLSPPDLYMLQTHNDIQTNVDSSKVLTHACVKSVNFDYNCFAGLVELFCLYDYDLATTNRKLDNFRETLRLRVDVLDDPTDIFLTACLKKELDAANAGRNKSNGSSGTATNPFEHLRSMRTNDLTMQKRSIMNAWLGTRFA